jgi:hypothetical protein
MNTPNNSIIWQLGNAESAEERSRLVDVFLILCRVGDRIKALRAAHETAQNRPEIAFSGEACS